MDIKIRNQFENHQKKFEKLKMFLLTPIEKDGLTPFHYIMDTLKLLCTRFIVELAKRKKALN